MTPEPVLLNLNVLLEGGDDCDSGVLSLEAWSDDVSASWSASTEPVLLEECEDEDDCDVSLEARVDVSSSSVASDFFPAVSAKLRLELDFSASSSCCREPSTTGSGIVSSTPTSRSWASLS